MTQEKWPSLPLEEWKETYATLHMWTQIVGKIRLAGMPWINHSWHVALYVTARGLTTLPVSQGRRAFQVDFDFIDHALLIQTGEGDVRKIELKPMAVAEFYRRLVAAFSELGLEVKIHGSPNEVPEPIPFAEDREHGSYDPEYAGRWWRAVSQASRIFHDFRAPFVGKCSPVHFFWGAFDLAVTRFSGRKAPQHPGGFPHMPDWITREAYSHEVSSCGFWPGGGPVPYPVFYAYAYPEPEGFGSAPIRPAAALYSPDLREFLLPYEEMRKAGDPDAVLLEFLRSTYAAAADLGGWNREELERREDPRDFR